MYYSRGQRPFNKSQSRKGSFSGRNFSAPRRGFQGSYIKPSLFVNKAVPSVRIEESEPQHMFADFEVNSQLKNNISRKGYVKPTPIQDGTISHALKGRDVVGIANTGTGKTAAFAIPLIQKIIEKNYTDKALIVAPTRELAIQIRDEIQGLASGLPIFTTVVIGGANMHRQIESLRRRNHFIIGTPGRIKDLIDRRALKLDNCNYLVLDEVDRMLDMGFVHDITSIVSLLPSHQTLFFSATMSSSVERVMHKFLKDPIRVSVKTQETSNQVEQDVVKVKSDDKIKVLTEMLAKVEFRKVLIFGRTKHGVERLSQKLALSGFKAGSIHGDKPQNKREKTLRMFRENSLTILVATDVAARGLDIVDITHVINFDIPATYEDYIHRIGRTGRGDNLGFAFTFIEG